MYRVTLVPKGLLVCRDLQDLRGLWVHRAHRGCRGRWVRLVNPGSRVEMGFRVKRAYQDYPENRALQDPRGRLV